MKDILTIARECGASGPLSWPAPGLFMFDALSIERFAQRIREQETERCAALCDAFTKDDMPGAALGRTIRLAAAIRTPSSSEATEGRMG